MTTEALDRAAEVAVREASETADDALVVDPHADRTVEFRRIGLTRMRTDWRGDDAVQIDAVKGIVEDRMLHLFPEAYVIMNDLWEIVRDKEVDADGVPIKDVHGFDIWKRTSIGSFVEDYSRLGIRERQDFLFKITTNIFEWEQTAANLWGEAMFAKAEWEQAMADGFLTTIAGKNTDEARTQRGRLASADERYFGIFAGLLSRKADALVRSMVTLGQRLKDTLE
jgi:hypothetical protein